MKYVIGLFLAGLPLFKSLRVPVTPEYPVVIELFTSQGCSSCPAADELLNKTIREAEEAGRPVLGLSFHVSYWNYLGWKDPYSSEDFTNRQKNYADALGLGSIYTPQIIVNGESAFVGSDQKALEAAITRGLQESRPYTISAASSFQGHEAAIRYALNHEPNKDVLNIALVESSVENLVPRGENRGKILKHYNVVRKLETRQVSKAGELRISIPPEVKSIQRTSWVLYIQNPTTLKILAAIQLHVTS